MVKEQARLHEARLLQLQPGDTVILRYTEKLTQKRRDEIKELAQIVFQDNRVLVLDNETDLLVHRKGNANA